MGRFGSVRTLEVKVVWVDQVYRIACERND